MRIGLISSSYPSDPEDSSNAGVFVRDLAWLLATWGHTVVVVSPHCVRTSPDQPFTVERFRWPGAEKSLTHVDPRSRTNLVRLAILLMSGLLTSVRVVRRHHLEHVLAMWAVPSGIFALAVRLVLGTPYSVWALGSDVWKVRSYPFGSFLLRRVLRGATHVYADGMTLAADVERLSGRSCTFLPSSRAMPPRGEVAPMSLTPDKTHVLCVARMHPHKGVDVLVRAVSGMPSDVRGRMQFHVFGGGPDREMLASLVRQFGLQEHVVLGDFLSPEELMAYLVAVDVLVIPSRVESIPLILSDAAQARCLVIATDVGDMGRLVRDYGLGAVVPAEDPVSLAAAIVRADQGLIAFEAESAERLVEDLALASSARQLLSAMSREKSPR